MELEFDKEIDALLRKAKRGSPAVAGVPAATPHLDADELASFAENALPDRARATYVAHMADCDTCRTMLSSFVTTAPEKAAAAAAFAASPVTQPAIPWWRRLFLGPNLAYTMGSLVVLFSGLIGLLVYQNQQATPSSRSAQIAEARPTPNTESEAPQTFSNASAANTAANSNAASPVESVTKTGVAVGSTSPGTEPEQQAEGQRADSSNEIASAKPADQPATNSAAAPPPVTKEETSALADRDVAAEKQPLLDKSKDDRISATAADEQRKKVGEDNKSLREAPAKAAPLLRSSGPRQQQQANAQNNTVQQQANGASVNGRNIDGLAVGGNTESRRSVGGKTFEMRSGVWYDSAYHGGGTKDVKRGTEKYIRLDQGLRNIADSLGGTLVIVWDGKAYKIK